MEQNNIRIGEVLKKYGFITEEQLNNALVYQMNNPGERLGNVMITLGYITEKQMLQGLAVRLGLKTADIAVQNVQIEAVRQIPRQMAERYCMLAIASEVDTLSIVTNDPVNFYAMEDVRQVTGKDLRVLLCEKAPLEKAIRYYYSEVSAQKAAYVANVISKGEEIGAIVMEAGDDDTPIINLLNSLILRAHNTNASDIHIEPFEDKTMVRMRIDGTIMEYVTLQKGLHVSLIARIKIMSDMDIAERRIPQDGHFRFPMDTELINIRASVIPTVFGEKAVMRILADNSHIDHSKTYGMLEEDFEKFQHMLESPNGIIYLTGPTGSGKSTTLYMVLAELSKKNVNISTIEDPVEKNLPKLNQMQVNNQAGLTFETGLRALLRQDPDIIMVGETRDAETASISVRAAITGHLVFSTLHTNDSASSIVRLIDMGLEPYLVSSSLVGIMAQRLMRKVCPDCAQDSPLTDREKVFLGRDLAKVKKPVGCALCNYAGYRGRVAIHEILVIDKKIREMITNNVSVDEIKDFAIREQNMKTLKECGVNLVEAGITTIEELRKVAF